MLRISLIAVVLLMLALPQGICFCEMLHVAVAGADEHDDSDEQEPTDCSCKLIHAMASVEASSSTPQPSSGFMPLDDVVFASVLDGAALQTFSSRPTIPPIALIPCALRI